MVISSIMAVGRRSRIRWALALVGMFFGCLQLCPPAAGLAPLPVAGCGPSTVQPVVIDTDIGSFIDDTFAVVFALKSRLLDVKLIVTCSDDTTARAKITAKLLTLVDRDDIPIGIGVQNDNKTQHALYDWAKDFDLSAYKGGVFSDGVGKMAEVIDKSSSIVTILAIGPMTNFPDLITKYPRVVSNANIKAMAGSLYKGYDNSSTPVPEYNVRLCPGCMEKLLSAGWDVTMAPLDITGLAALTAPQMARLFAHNSPYELALISSLVFYCTQNTTDICQLNVISPHLHDTVATLLLLPEANQFAVFQRMKLSVTADGHTVVDDNNGVPVIVALDWKTNGLLHFQEYMASLL